MNIHDERIARAKAVQNKYATELMKKPHVIGVSLGRQEPNGDQNAGVVLVVLVSETVPPEQLAPEDRIPTSLDGVPVIVRQVGTFEAL